MENNPTENKKGLLQNDRVLVCGMLLFYGFCFIGLGGAAFWWLNQRSQILSAGATSTAIAANTEQAGLTATAITHRAEQDQYEYIERFDKITGRWFVGSYDKQYGDVYIKIKDGFYIWKVTDPKGFSQSTDFQRQNKIRDFDVYMDLKFMEYTKFGAVCSGFFFRKSSNDWEDGVYTFTICNDSHFEIHYYGNKKWQVITKSKYEGAIRRRDWNRIEIHARGDHFIFIVNNAEIFEMTDDRLRDGGLGIFVNVENGNSAEIWFDNFGFQSR